MGVGRGHIRPPSCQVVPRALARPAVAAAAAASRSDSGCTGPAGGKQSAGRARRSVVSWTTGLTGRITLAQTREEVNGQERRWEIRTLGTQRIGSQPLSPPAHARRPVAAPSTTHRPCSSSTVSAHHQTTEANVQTVPLPPASRRLPFRPKADCTATIGRGAAA